MKLTIILKLGQVGGALLMAAGVAACNMDKIENSPMLFLLGGVLFGGCALWRWLRKPD